jgi:hypothetical protein
MYIAVGLGTGETRATFLWDSDLTATDDGLNVIIPTAMPRTGCWKRPAVEAGLSV